MNAIYTPEAPEAVGPYSQAILSGGTLYTSGQIPLDPKTGTLVEGGIEEQWDSYIKTLETMGYNDFIQIQKDAYNTYNANK